MRGTGCCTGLPHCDDEVAAEGGCQAPAQVCCDSPPAAHHRHLLLTTGTNSLSFTTSSCSTWLLLIDMASKWVDGEWEVVGGGWGSIRISYDNGYDKLIIKYDKNFNNRYIY